MASCTNCGTQINDGSRFCPKCGAAVVAASVTEPAYNIKPQGASQPDFNMQSQPQPSYNPQPQTQPAFNAQPQMQSQPVYTTQPQNPAYAASPSYTYSAASKAEVPASAKVKGYIGMGLGIESLPMSFIAFICAMMALTVGDSDFGFNTMAPPAICFCIFQLAISIAALILSSSSRNSGFTESATKLGKVFGLIGTTITGISLLFALISLG